jgi:DNA-binding NarL/FixJ family response regulator
MSGDVMKILLVDDHSLVRLGLTEVIETDDSMKVVCALSSGAEMLEQYESVKPDVFVIDFRMPNDDGVSITKKLLEEKPDAKVLMLSVYEGEEDLWRAYQAGVKGYLSKSADVSDLRLAIKTIGEGKEYFPERIAQKIEQRRGRSNLTKREQTIVQLLVRGLSNQEMSEELGISIPTVKLHVGNMIAKLGVKDRTQAAIAAVQRGVVHIDD